MAMICCPECGKDISDSAKSCPHCGIKLKKSKLPIIVILCVSFVILILAVFCGFRYVSKVNLLKAQAQVVVDEIDCLGSATIENADSILAAQCAYEALGDAQKYVTNASILEHDIEELENIEIPLTDENFWEYIQFDVDIRNPKSDRVISLIPGYTIYNNYADVTVSISPTTKLKYKDISFAVDLNLDYGIYGWEGETFTATLDDDGMYQYSKQVKYQGLIQYSAPTYTQSYVVLKNVSGVITFK